MNNSMKPLIALQGKTALITGGSSGIGLACAKLFLSCGAKVAILGRDAKALAQAREQLMALDASAELLTLQANVIDLAQLRTAKEQVHAHWGRLDVLFANAGVAYATPLQTTDEQTYSSLMDINVKGVFFTVQQFAPLMQAGGSIILNTSWLAEVGTANLSLLSASKAAVRSLARTLSAELLSQGIRVNAVSPGAINTPIHTKTGMPPEQLQAFADRIAKSVPLGRFGTAEEVAQAALFLASDASSYMLGAEIVVDGGFSQL
jgi:NAD(P)-dependent dehydrogenase (short-subunit alcohol dehydrogenase family)